MALNYIYCGVGTGFNGVFTTPDKDNSCPAAEHEFFIVSMIVAAESTIPFSITSINSPVPRSMHFVQGLSEVSF